MVFYGHTRNTFTGSANNTLCYRYKTTECARHSTNPNRKEEIKIETDRVFKRTQKCIDNMVFVGTWRRYWPQGIGNLSGFWSNSGISSAGSELRRITTNCARHGWGVLWNQSGNRISIPFISSTRVACEGLVLFSWEANSAIQHPITRHAICARATV